MNEMNSSDELSDSSEQILEDNEISILSDADSLNEISLESTSDPESLETKEDNSTYSEESSFDQSIEVEKIPTTQESLITFQNELEEISAKRNELQINLNVLEDELEKNTRSLEDLENWVENRKKSYASKLLKELESRRGKLEHDEERLKAFIETAVPLDKDFVSRTRKWILRSFFRNLFITLSLLSLLSYLQRNRSSVLKWLRSPSDISFYESVKLFFNELLTNLNIPYLMFLISILSFLMFIKMLFSYSRKVSSNDRLLQEEASKVRAYTNAVFEIRSARERIDSLHPQVRQLLEVWSRFLHEPFKIDSKYTDFATETIVISDLPESVEFASPTRESIDRVFENLVLLTLNEIQTIGWRDSLLDESLQAVGTLNGMGKSGSTSEELNEDHRRGGKRQILLDTDSDSFSKALYELGDRKVQLLAEAVQEKVLFNAHPKVKSLRLDPLSSLDISEDIGSPIDTQESTWENKLAEAAVASSNWSILNFSNEGQSQGKHLEEIDSLFIASRNVVNSVNVGISTFPFVEPGNKPFEVSIRADLSSWCKPGDLSIFEGLPSSETDPINMEPDYKNLELQNDNVIY